MKKVLSVIMSIVMALSLFAALTVNSFAADAVGISVDRTDMKTGETVTATVRVPAGYTAFEISLKYNHDLLKVVSYKTYQWAMGYYGVKYAGAGSISAPSKADVLFQVTFVAVNRGDTTIEAVVDEAIKETEKEVTIVDVNGADSANIHISGFADVQKTDWFNDSVEFVYANGIMKGYASNGLFGPADNIIRQDFAVVMAKAAGADLNNQSTKNIKFPDIDKDAYYAKALAWCVDNGIITGYQNGKFGPADPITREQICLMVTRYISLSDETYTDITAEEIDSLLQKFPDKGRVSDWSKTAVALCLRDGVISGAKGGTEIQPYANANRAQIATIFMNLSTNGII